MIDIPELSNCTICPQACGTDRYREAGFCGAGRQLKINLAQLHHGEEPVLSGTRGSGTIFFSHCNLRCVFCQNHEISHLGWGTHYTEEECADLMLRLQDQGAHNINLVSPTQYTPQLVSALTMARTRGLGVPVVWNSNAYECVDTLQRLKGLVDIYLPDYKYASADKALKYSSAPDYPVIALKAIHEMWKQVGELVVDEDDIALKGVIVRHLVLPNRIAGSAEVVRVLHREFGPSLALSLMAQYYTAGNAGSFPELSRGLKPLEYKEILDLLPEFGFEWVFAQDLDSSPEWTPEFHEGGDKHEEKIKNFFGRNNP
jgi:putative pyruvate formate lyase activating enzyme